MATAAAVIEAEERINTVHIEGLVRYQLMVMLFDSPPEHSAFLNPTPAPVDQLAQALLKIVKHCHDSLPNIVTGSLLGLEVGGGVLEITHAFPVPDPRSGPGTADHKSAAAALSADAATVASTLATEGGEDAAALEGHEYQLEMMRMLREINVDNNCVGYYQTMLLGIYSTTSLLENQLSYQTDLSPNAVVILYDPMQTAHGQLVLKCFRLTDECIRMKLAGDNSYLDPKNIFEQVPIQLTNPGLVRALLRDVMDGLHSEGPDRSIMGTMDPTNKASSWPEWGTDTTFDRLDLSTNPYLEKHLEFLSGFVEDLAAEQQKFQYYSRQLARNSGDRRSEPYKNKKREDAADAWASPEAPRRLESLLMTNQIRSYCDQMDNLTAGGIGKLFAVSGLQQHHQQQQPPPVSTSRTAAR